MKKNLFLTFLTFFIVSASVYSLDSRALELESAYQSGFLPGVVRIAEDIIRSGASKGLVFKAQVYEGESLYRIGRKNEAEEFLSSADFRSENDDESLFLNSAKNYWLGRIYFDKLNFIKAQNSFFQSSSDFSKIKKNAGKTDYFSKSVLFGARCYKNLDESKKAVPLLEYVVANGRKYTQEEFEESSINLASFYNIEGEFSKTLDFMTKIENSFDSFSVDTMYSLMILKGDAENGLKNYKSAYDIYCKVLAEAAPFLATSAMQKAYDVSTQHRFDVGEEPGSVLAQAEVRLKEFPVFLSEFWTRLAIDAFNSGDYEKSLSYFDRARIPSSDFLLQTASVFRAEIAYLTAGDKLQGAKSASEILYEIKKSTKVDEASEIAEQINVNLARYNGILKNWDECENFARTAVKSVNPSVQKNALYWTGVALYEKGQPQESVSILSDYYESDNSLKLFYAKALATSGNLKEAEKIYESLGEKNLLKNQDKIDYSRTLLNDGKLRLSKNQSERATGDEAKYLSAIASFNQRKWDEAQKLFSAVLNSKTLDKKFVSLSEFYCGYSDYQLGNYKSACSLLLNFAQKNPSDSLRWISYMTFARASILAEDYDSACTGAKKALENSENENQKHQAILLLSGIYSDTQKFDEAMAVLNPYFSENSNFSVECKYAAADIMIRAKKMAEAEKYFLEISRTAITKQNELLVEESCYRLGELKYSSEEFDKASEYFEEYRKRFSNGRFLYASIYFAADSFVKTEFYDRAILLYRMITDSKDSTSYRYGAEKNLIELYERRTDYDKSIEIAKKMIAEFGSQAISDGIGDKLRELELMNLGNDRKVVQKQREYEKAGGISTEKGRKLGTELADIMASIDSYQKNAVVLAEKLFAVQKENSSESLYACKNAMLLGRLYRNSNENEKSAKMYLDAAMFARAVGDKDFAARSFYGAIESFDAAGLVGDAADSLEIMKELYPNSEYTKNAEKILKEVVDALGI